MDGILGFIARPAWFVLIELGDVMRELVDPPFHARELLAHAANVGPGRQVQQVQAAPRDALGRPDHFAADAGRRADHVEVGVRADRRLDRLADGSFDSNHGA